MADAKLDADIEELEKKYDTALQMRDLAPGLARILFAFSILFAGYHYYTAGFGTPADYWHMGIHLAGLSILIFTGFPLVKPTPDTKAQSPLDKINNGFQLAGVPLLDWLLALLGVLSALYIGFSWNGFEINLPGLHYRVLEQSLRQGEPNVTDLFFGTILVLLVLEMARRTLGPVLPAIILIFIAYALFGPWLPVPILKHPGVDWAQFINNIYFPSEGIFGVTLWVVSTIVFYFVLFGVVAQKMGLGQLFIDNAMILAGRYTGGPAKVSVVSSAFFGTISGSSIANTVSTGSLTIPNMKRLGYPPHFAGGVEAAASAGGQITPPIMGAAAFLMAEFLQMPYTQIVIAAIIPALMHYIGVLALVHFEAKRLGLAGYPAEKLPQFAAVWRQGWPAAIPLVVLLAVLFTGFTPNYAAFAGITSAILIGFFNPSHRMSLKELLEAVNLAVKYALAVGAAGAAVGIVVGVINTTGLAFRLGFMVTSGAAELAAPIHALLGLLPLEIFTSQSLELFISLVLIAIACILMGAGLPTTALYIMLAAVAQPALKALGVPPLAAHMFVLYYGVISEITPPVCASAYAAAGIAGANPFRTGVSAFTLGIGKLLVPMVFVYAPVMLIVLPEYFTWTSFLQVSLTCALGVLVLAAAISGFYRTPLSKPMRWAAGIAGLLLVAPSSSSDLIAAVILVPLAVQQYLTSSRKKDNTGGIDH